MALSIEVDPCLMVVVVVDGDDKVAMLLENDDVEVELEAPLGARVVEEAVNPRRALILLAFG